MEPRCIVLALVLLCAFIFTGSEGTRRFGGVKGGFPTCCLIPSEKAPLRILKDATSFKYPTKGGACEMNVLIVTIKGKRYCIPPRYKNKLKQIIKKNRQKRRRQN